MDKLENRTVLWIAVDITAASGKDWRAVAGALDERLVQLRNMAPDQRPTALQDAVRAHLGWGALTNLGAVALTVREYPNLLALLAAESSGPVRPVAG